MSHSWTTSTTTWNKLKRHHERQRKWTERRIPDDLLPICNSWFVGKAVSSFLTSPLLRFPNLGSRGRLRTVLAYEGSSLSRMEITLKYALLNDLPLFLNFSLPLRSGMKKIIYQVHRIPSTAVVHFVRLIHDTAARLPLPYLGQKNVTHLELQLQRSFSPVTWTEI